MSPEKDDKEMDPERSANLRALLEQHVTHCRHIEIERAGLMSVYAAIVGALFGFFASRDVAVPSEGAVLLVLLTIFGLILTLRWTQAFEHHRREADRLSGHLWTGLGGTPPTMKVPGLMKTRYIFPLFYEAALITLAVYVWFPPLINPSSLARGIAACAAAGGFGLFVGSSVLTHQIASGRFEKGNNNDSR